MLQCAYDSAVLNCVTQGNTMLPLLQIVSRKLFCGKLDDIREQDVHDDWSNLDEHGEGCHKPVNNTECCSWCLANTIFGLDICETWLSELLAVSPTIVQTFGKRLMYVVKSYEWGTNISTAVHKCMALECSCHHILHHVIPRKSNIIPGYQMEDTQGRDACFPLSI